MHPFCNCTFHGSRFIYKWSGGCRFVALDGRDLMDASLGKIEILMPQLPAWTRVVVSLRKSTSPYFSALKTFVVIEDAEKWNEIKNKGNARIWLKNVRRRLKINAGKWFQCSYCLVVREEIGVLWVEALRGKCISGCVLKTKHGKLICAKTTAINIALF